MAWVEPRESDRGSGLRAPALVLLAVASLLEGYASLGTIGSPAFVIGPVGVTLFAFGCGAAGLHLTRPAREEARNTAERYLLCACILLAGATLTLVVGVSGFGSRLVGVADLLVAIACLAAAAMGERRSVRRSRSASHPSHRGPETLASEDVGRWSATVGPGRSRRRIG